MVKGDQWTHEQWIEWTIDQLIDARLSDDWVLIRDVINVLREVVRGVGGE